MTKSHTPASRQTERAKAVACWFIVALGLAVLGSAGCQRASGTSNGGDALVNLHLEAFVVNLADNDGRSFLRVGIDLGIEDREQKARGERRAEPVAVIRDTVISLLSTLKADDLLTPDGKKRLKQDLIKALDDRLPELKVKEVYFNEFMVQR